MNSLGRYVDIHIYMFIGIYVRMFLNSFLAPVRLSPNFVSYTLGHRGWGD